MDSKFTLKNYPTSTPHRSERLQNLSKVHSQNEVAFKEAFYDEVNNIYYPDFMAVIADRTNPMTVSPNTSFYWNNREIAIGSGGNILQGRFASIKNEIFRNQKCRH